MSTTPARARATVRQYTPDDQYYDEPSGAGWIMFAGLLLAILGTLNLIDGIAAVSNSTFFVNDAKFIVSDLNTWGWLLIATGVVQLLAALGVWVQANGVRWVGVAIAALNLIAQMFFIAAYPLWAVMLITLDVLVIYGLVAHGARRD